MQTNMLSYDKKKRFIVCCYSFFSLCFFILSTISLLMDNQFVVYAFLVEIFFISTFGYGLFGLITMKEEFIKIFLKMLFAVILILIYHLFVLILSLLNTNNEYNSENIQIIYGINIVLIVLLLFYISISFICIKLSQELVSEIRKSQNVENEMLEMQSQLIQKQLDYENQYIYQQQQQQNIQFANSFRLNSVQEEVVEDSHIEGI